jgi:hypothetical protein
MGAVLLGSFLVMLILGIPIALSIGASALLVMIF